MSKSTDKLQIIHKVVEALKNEAPRIQSLTIGWQTLDSGVSNEAVVCPTLHVTFKDESTLKAE